MDPETDRPDSELGLGRLAGELMKLARTAPEELAARIRRLSVREQAELALRLPASKRLDMLLHAPKPMRLVRALPDAELYLTAREVGPADALPLLALASASQLHHVIDLEAWRGDRFDFDRAGAWVAVLLESGEPALRRFLRNADDELLALLLHGWMQVVQIEFEDRPEKHGHGEGDAGTEQGYLTPDGHHRFSPRIAEHAPVIRRLLQMFFQEHPDRYSRVLWLSRWELPSELEEQAHRWRQSRLDEHGIPEWNEAIEVYAPPSDSASRPAPLTPTDPDGLAAPRTPLRHLEGHDALVRAIDDLADPRRERMLHEILAVANRLLVADGADLGDPTAHRLALEKTAGALALALSEEGAADSGSTARVLEQVPVLDLFRRGHARIVNLQEGARRMVDQGWAAAHPRALDLLDAPIQERIRGLLADRPLYYDPDRKPSLRPFRSVTELEETRVALEMAELIGRVLADHLGFDTSRVLRQAELDEQAPPRFSAFFLTLLAWSAARDELRGEPLPADVTADFLRNVGSRRTAGPDAPGRALESLVRRLAERASLSPREISVLQAYGRFALEKLAEECAGLDPGSAAESKLTCLILEPE